MTVSKLFRTAALAVAVLAPVTTQAQTSFVNSRGGITGTTLNWNTIYGASGTPVSNTPTATGVPGLTISASNPGGVEVRNQDSGWGGAFLPNEPVLYSMGNGVLSLLFNTDIFAFGANMHSDYYGAFTGTIKAYDASNSLLGMFSLNGTSSSAADGSAPFFGVSSTSGIRRVTFEVSGQNLGGTSLGINQAVVQTGPSTTVPEPSTYLLMASGLAAIAAVGRRRRVKA